MFADLDMPTRQILIGNLSMIVCCVFYLAWWVIAFKPTGAIKGMKSGWLLFPALIFGVMGAVWIVKGSLTVERAAMLFGGGQVLLGGIILYIVLMLLTSILLKRQVTTELLLIVGWLMLMFLELSALYAQSHYTLPAAVVLLVVTVIAAAVSLICYLLYYNLSGAKGYFDGMVPLVLVAVMMAVVTAIIAL